MIPNTGTMPRHGKPLMIQWGSKMFPIYDGVTEGPWEVSQYQRMNWGLGLVVGIRGWEVCDAG